MSNIKLKAPAGGSVQITPTDTAANYTVTLPATDGTVAMTSDIPVGIVTLTGTQTLTNKTLTAPVINSGVTITGDITSYGAGGITTNTAIGTDVLETNTTGGNNTAVGYQSMSLNTTGSGNTAVGIRALRDNTTGLFNTADGNQALLSNTTGYNNTASGATALQANTTGHNNTADGFQALFTNTVGYSNTAVGANSLYKNTTGANNTVSGYSAMGENTTGDNNTVSGMNAMFYNVTGSRNTVVGKEALLSLTAGSDNTAIGSGTGGGIVSGSGNTIVGATVTGLSANLTNNIILANGTGAIKAQHDGTNWTLQGNVSATGTMSGTDTVTLTGTQTLTNKTLTAPVINSGVTITGDLLSYGSGTPVASNLAVGSGALEDNTTGFSNTALGFDALTNNTDGNNNTVIGKGAAFVNTQGAANTVVGVTALYQNTTGTNNTAIGVNALGANTTGANQTAVGVNALVSSQGTQNTVVGSLAGSQLITGENNTILGYSAGNVLVTGSGNTILGANAVVPDGVDNHIIIANGFGVNGVKAHHNGTDWILTGNVTATGTMSGTDTVTLTGTQTLTNKTLTAPVLANPSYSGTTANGGTVTTIDINGGTIDGTVIGQNSALAVYATTLNTSSTPIFDTNIGYIGKSGSGLGGNWWYKDDTGTSRWLAGLLGGAGATYFSIYDIVNAKVAINIAPNPAQVDITTTGLAVTGALSCTGNTTLGDAAGDTLNVANGTLRLDASGNLGLGVTPSAWVAGSKNAQVGLYSAIGQDTDGALRLTHNSYEYAVLSYKYIASVGASRYQQLSGAHSWFTAPSGTAGNAITFTQSLAVGLGTTLALEGATSAAGTGIAFPATQVASSNANTLDDYEEGTWTPTQGAGLTVVGTFISSGTYTKIGRQVTVRGTVGGSTSIVVAANSVLCGGIPFAASGDATGSATNASMTNSATLLVTSGDIYSTAIATASSTITFTATYFV